MPNLTPNPERVAQSLEGCGDCEWGSWNDDLGTFVHFPLTALCPACQLAAQHKAALAAWAVFLFLNFHLHYRDRPLPDYPCYLPPGSDAKIQIMRQRVARGQQPCHPDDAPAPPGGVQQFRLHVRNGRDKKQPFSLRPGAGREAA